MDEGDAEIGAQVLIQRIALVHELRPHVARAYEQVSDGQGAAVLGYRSSLVESGAAGPEDGAPAPTAGIPHLGATVELLEAQLLEAMSRLRPREIERGVNLVGPHRDDLVLTLGELPAKGYASHGESWSFALALRLGSFELLTHGSSGQAATAGVADAYAGWDEGSEPVLILDDVFAELDTRRRGRLAGLVSGAEQVLLTAAVAEDVPEQLDGARVDVFGGQARHVR